MVTAPITSTSGLISLQVTSLLHPRLVWLNMPDKPIEELAEWFASRTAHLLHFDPAKKSEFIKEAIQSVTERQKLSPLAIGAGLAFLYPGMSVQKWNDAGLNPGFIGIGIAKKPIRWRLFSCPPNTNDTLDHGLIESVIFEISNDGRVHLAKMAKITRLFNNPSLRQDLKFCQTPTQVCKTLKIWEKRIKSWSQSNKEELELELFPSAYKKLNQVKLPKSNNGISASLYPKWFNDKIENGTPQERLKALLAFLDARESIGSNRESVSPYFQKVLECANSAAFGFKVAETILIKFRAKCAQELRHLYEFRLVPLKTVAGIEKALVKWKFLKGNFRERVAARVKKIEHGDLLPYNIRLAHFGS